MTRWTCPRYEREFTKVLSPSASRVVHLPPLRDATEVDEQVRSGLTEAYLHASGEAPRR